MLEKQKFKKKEKKIKKSQIYDIENFTVSYSKNEIFIRNINTEYNRTINYKRSNYV